MKLIYIAIGLASWMVSCKEPSAVTARPDPHTSTSGTLGSVKATDGTLPAGETRPHKTDSARMIDSVRKNSDTSRKN